MCELYDVAVLPSGRRSFAIGVMAATIKERWSWFGEDGRWPAAVGGSLGAQPIQHLAALVFGPTFPARLRTIGKPG